MAVQILIDDALDALSVGIMQARVNWILDADIRSFFDKIDQTWLIKFLKHRIGDERVIRLVCKWLKAGVLDQGTLALQVRRLHRPWMFTYDDSPQIEAFYQGLSTCRMDLLYSAQVRRLGCELLVMAPHVALPKQLFGRRNVVRAA